MALLLPSQNVAGNCQFIADRADWVMYGSPDAVLSRYPSLAFGITTAGGNNCSVASSEVLLEGTAWIDVRQITLGGVALELIWIDGENWQVTVPLVIGPNELTLVATDLHGDVVGTDSIVVTSTE